MHFLLTLGMFLTMSLCFNCWFWTGKYRLWRLSKMKDLYQFHINVFSSFFRPLVFRVVFFPVFYFIGETTYFRVTIFKQTYKIKKEFWRQQRVWPEASFLMVNKTERSKIRIINVQSIFKNVRRNKRYIVNVNLKK